MNTISLPLVIVPYRVTQSIIEESLQYPETETGQAVFGLILPGDSPEAEPTIVVLGTIPAFHGDRGYGHFKAGGKDQAQILRWYRYHWEFWRSQSRTATELPKLGQPLKKGQIPTQLDVPLSYLGDWHKHPGGYNNLSHVDLQQITELLNDRNLPQVCVLAPLVTVAHINKLSYTQNGDSMLVRQCGPEITISWNYFRGKTSIRVLPKLVEDNQIPWLPPLPWYLSNPKRFKVEVNLLQQNGCLSNWAVKNFDGDPSVLEIGFALDRPRWKSRVLIITTWDYPAKPPKIEILPKTREETLNGHEPTITGNGQTVAETKEEYPKARFFDRLGHLVGSLFAQPPIIVYADFPYPSGYKRRWDSGTYLVDIVAEMEREGQL